jgi:hypothetical protein
MTSAAFAAPPAALMVLSAADFPDGGVLAAQSDSVPAVLATIPRSSSYSRAFTSAVFHNEDLVSISSSALVAKNASDITKFMSSLALITHSKAGQKGLVAGIQKEFATKTKVLSGRLLRARILRLPDEAIDLAVSLKFTGGNLEIGELWLEEGSALSFTIYVSKVFTAGDSAALARAVDEHIQIASTTIAPTNGTLPTISGTAEVSQTLTAVPGTWTGKSELGIQWLRCSSAGSQCSAIADATTPTYLVAAADVGSTLEIDVTATNGAGTTSAQSGPSAVVS